MKSRLIIAVIHTQLSSCEIKARKKIRPEWVPRTHDLCDTGAVLY